MAMVDKYRVLSTTATSVTVSRNTWQAIDYDIYRIVRALQLREASLSLVYDSMSKMSEAYIKFHDVIDEQNVEPLKRFLESGQVPESEVMEVMQATFRIIASGSYWQNFSELEDAMRHLMAISADLNLPDYNDLEAVVKSYGFPLKDDYTPPNP